MRHTHAHTHRAVIPPVWRRGWKAGRFSVRTVWRTTKGVVFHPIRTVVVVLLVLLLFPAARPDLYWALKQGVKGGGALITPNAFTCQPPLPEGGAVGVAARLGGLLHGMTGPAPTPQVIEAHIMAGAQTAGRVWRAFHDGVNGSPAPMAGPVPPALQVDLPTSCCPATVPNGIPISSTDPAPVVAARAAIAAGFTGPDLLVALEVAGAESGYLATAANPTSTARGVWQILLSAHPGLLPGGTWADPYANARAAKTVHDDARGWTPWVTWSSGAYLRWHDVAVQAIAKASGQYGPFLAVDFPTTTAPTATCTPTLPASGDGAKALAAAMTQVGVPYQWGADKPGVAFDCSGLTAWAWGLAGVTLPHQSGLQSAAVPHVPIAAAQPGDLLFFGSPIHHVGIYISPGSMVDAPHAGALVRVESYTSWPDLLSYVGRPQATV